MTSNPDFWEIPLDPSKLDGFSTGRALWRAEVASPARAKPDASRRNAVNRLRDLVDQDLTPRQRDCVRLCFFEGRTQQQAADQLGISRRVVSQHLLGIVRNGRRIGGALKRLGRLCREHGLQL